VSQKPCQHHILKLMKGISPNFVADEFRFIDVLVKFWGQKVKVTAGSDPENCVNAISS